jgi:catechol 2,3-dioxygenase-like lactoylglutathione lyase family enzyme
MNLDHVTLIVTELQRLNDVYRTLGLAPIVHSLPRHARFVCPQGDTTLSIEVTGEAAWAARTQLYFECDPFDQRVEPLRAAGVAFRQRPTDMEYLWGEARLSDPDGHELQLYAAGRNRRDPPWKIGAAGLPGWSTRTAMDAAPSTTCKVLGCGHSPPVDRSTCSPGLRSATGHRAMPLPCVRSRLRGEHFHD